MTSDQGRERHGLDAITSAAFALYGRPGAYAVLLGSGVSTGAGVPTGWRIVERLIVEVARAEQQDIGTDAFVWYRKRFEQEPTYSGLVAALGLTNAERQALIARFIEGEDGPRHPSPAHHAIARLVAGGWVRVILTTNFDRLLDNALVEAGVTATVLATPDAMEGALPLVHAGPVLVKLHGDQSDPLILNTEMELTSYPPAINSVLDRVFDEYGLVVCGWSGDHDIALRAALERTTSRRFTTYWASHGDLQGTAEALVSLREAEVAEHVDADTFFGRLADACEALTAARRPHPLTVSTAVAMAKRQLSGAPVAIPFHDTIRSELERVQQLQLLSADPRNAGNDQVDVVRRATGELEVLVALVATAAYWGRPETDRWWTADIVRLARRPLLSGQVNVLDRPRIPAFFMAWAAGTAAVAARRDDLVATLLALEDVPEPAHDEHIPALLAASADVLHIGDHTALIYRALRPVFVEHLALGKQAFVDAWERWQYLLLLAVHDMRGRRNVWVSRPGAAIRVEGLPVVPVPDRWVRLELGQLGEAHPLLRAGYFEGDTAALLASLNEVADVVAKESKEEDWRIIEGTGGGSLPSGRHYPGHFSDDPDELFRS